MNRDQINRLILATSPANLLGEVSYLVHDIGDREYPYDELAALFDIEDRNEGPEGNRTLLRQSREMLVALGYYRPMPAEEIDNTIVSRGAVWAFKLKGVAYTSDDPVELWQWPGQGKFA